MRRDEGIGVNADEQVGLHASRLLHPRVQWHKIIGLAREEGAHRIVADAAAVDAFGQQTGNPQYHVFFSCAAGAYGTGILAAMARGEGSGSMSLIGFVLTLGSAALWSVANLITRHAAKSGPYEPLPFLVWSSIFPIIPLLILSQWLESPHFGSIATQLQAAGWVAVGSVAYLALASTLLGYGLWTKLLQRYSVGTVAPLSLLVPVIGIVSGMLAFGERPVLLHWLGTLGVLVGMAINQWGGRWAKKD